MKKNSDILVSITCITYNHEKYIADALDSFLMQKTNFNYEILIHDDASTDQTAQIIREYEKKYPDIIKPIYQTENQYSKGIRVGDFNRKRVMGKYIAICEGDDYWQDPYKLEKQVEYMEAHPECSLYVHAAYRVSPNNKKMKCHVSPFSKSREVSIEEVIEGGGDLFATSSYFYPSKFKDNLPNFYEISPIGDYPLVVYLALNGMVYYNNNFMSAYRVNVSGSWVQRISSDINKKIDHFYKMNKMFDELNKYTNCEYQDLIEKINYRREVSLLLALESFKELDRLKSDKRYSEISAKTKFRIIFHQYLPGIAKKIEILAKRYI